MPNDIYDRVVSIGKVSDVIRDALSYYFASKESKQDNVPQDAKNESVVKSEDGDKPQVQYIKNASYYQKLKNYKTITQSPWDTFYVSDAWDLPKDVVLSTLWLSAEMFDPKDL